MANEIQIPHGITGQTVYAVIRNSVGAIWNGSAFVSYNAINWTTYKVALTEETTNGSDGYYKGDFPSGIVTAGIYNIEVRLQSGGSAAITDIVIGAGSIEWTGTSVVFTLGASDIRSAVGLASANLDTQLATKPTLAQILAGGDVDGFTLEQTLKLCLAALAGKLSGAGTTEVTIRAADDSKDRIVAEVTSRGNRTTVTLDATG